MDTATAVAVSMYKDGSNVADIIEATGLTQDQIGAAVTRTGTVFHADAVPLRPALVASELISWGMEHPAARMRKLAETARAALADLQQAKRLAEVVAAAEAKVTAARERLEAAEKVLRAAKSGAGTTTSAGRDTTENRLIRAWARERGHHVAGGGIIPRAIVDAYRAAQQEAGRVA